MKDAPTIIRYTIDFFYIKMVRLFNFVSINSYGLVGIQHTARRQLLPRLARRHAKYAKNYNLK